MLTRNAIIATLLLAPAAFAAPGVPLSADVEARKPVDVLPADLEASAKTRSDDDADPPAKFAWDKDGDARVLRVETFNKPKVMDHVSARWPVDKPIKRGDVLLARFAARALSAKQESGEALFELAVQQSQPQFARHVILPLSVGPAWTQFDVPFTAAADADAGQAVATLSFGSIPQSVEISGLRIINFERRARTADLPQTKLTYKGREADAAWRKAALERIEKIRTAPIELRVIDATCKPVVGAKVEVRLVRPAFLFGTEVNATFLLQDNADAERYRKIIPELFDTVVLGNALKWPKWTGSLASREEALRATDWLESKHLRMRGHNLVWPGDKFAPKRVVAMPPPRAELPMLIKEHIRDEAAALRGRLIAWDVINEMVHEKDYLKYMPESEAAEWFKLTREIDPHVQLFINEYGMLNGPKSPDMIRQYSELVARLKAAGAPIDGMGVQGHIGRQVRDPVDVLSDLDLLAKAGPTIQITEFDIDTPDEALQADYTRDFLIACYSHPAMSGFLMWGFWQSQHWKPLGAMIRPDWSEKPNAKVWRDLVCTQWRTRVDAKTDGNGRLATRGHLGDYEFDVTINGKTTREMRTLTQTGTAFTLQIP